MVMLGLDIGEKRIGIAVSDELEIMGLPLKVINNDEQAEGELNNLIKHYNIRKIVIGIPYTLKGEIGFQAKKIIDYADNILKKFPVEIIYADERFTSKIPKKLLKKNNKTGKIDKLSACIILNDYLESSKGKK